MMFFFGYSVLSIPKLSRVAKHPIGVFGKVGGTYVLKKGANRGWA
jgi:hypothetical protein